MKKYKGHIIISSIVVLLPMLLGVILWNQLPDTMITHWGGHGTPDGTMGKALAVFLIPVISLALHLVCVFFSLKDPKNKEQSDKVVSMIFWIVPIISLLMNGYIYAYALGSEINIAMTVMSLVGIVFILLGNYLPKCKPNRTIGIKVKWALENEENWVKTHRFAGKAWVLAGVFSLLSLAIPGGPAMMVSMCIMFVFLLAPVAYSYIYYRKQVKEGKIDKDNVKQTGVDKTTAVVHVVVGIILFVVVLGVIFAGNFEVTISEESLQIEASGWSDAEVRLAEIDRVDYAESSFGFSGTRDMGFGSPRITMGDCSNGEYGKFTAYIYEKCDAHIVIYVGDKIMILNRETEEETKALYEELKGKVEK